MKVPGTTAQGLLLAECWCHSGIVEVPADDVRAGRTASCGRTGCAAPTPRPS